MTCHATSEVGPGGPGGLDKHTTSDNLSHVTTINGSEDSVKICEDPHKNHPDIYIYIYNILIYNICICIYYIILYYIMLYYIILYYVILYYIIV